MKNSSRINNRINLEINFRNFCFARINTCIYYCSILNVIGLTVVMVRKERG